MKYIKILFVVFSFIFSSCFSQPILKDNLNEFKKFFEYYPSSLYMAATARGPMYKDLIVSDLSNGARSLFDEPIASQLKKEASEVRGGWSKALTDGAYRISWLYKDFFKLLEDSHASVARMFIDKSASRKAYLSDTYFEIPEIAPKVDFARLDATELERFLEGADKLRKDAKDKKKLFDYEVAGSTSSKLWPATPAYHKVVSYIEDLYEQLYELLDKYSANVRTLISKVKEATKE